MKNCKSCGTSKPLSDFWTQPRSPDGYYANCKDCERARRAAYNAQPHVRAARLAATNRWLRRNPDARVRAKDKHPERYRARRTVSVAVFRGKLQRRPCEVCGAKAQAHHEDYTKPLDVRWLCPLHHKAVHMAEKP